MTPHRPLIDPLVQPPSESPDETLTNPTAPLRVSSTRWEASASSQQTPPPARVTPSPIGGGSIGKESRRKPRLHSFYRRTAGSTFGARPNARHRRRRRLCCGARVPSWYAFFEFDFGHLAKVGVRHLGRDRKHAFLCSARTRPNTPPFEDAPYPNTLRPPNPNTQPHPTPTPLPPLHPKHPSTLRPQPPLPASTNPLNRPYLNRQPPPSTPTPPPTAPAGNRGTPPFLRRSNDRTCRSGAPCPQRP